MHLSWTDSELQTILLKCRNDEQLRQWLTAIIELKESSVKVDLISAPQTPRMDQNDPLLRYEDDEDDEDEKGEDEENHNPSFLRNRSYSYQHNRYPNEVSSRKASLSSTTVRHFMNGVPGMTIPPLPRSPTHGPNLSNASSSESTLYSPSNLSFPSSPPTSYPSSPTTTARTSSGASSNANNNGILPSGALWQRRQDQQNSIFEEEEEKSEGPLIQHVRVRSQSSPNIQRPIHHHQEPLPAISSANASVIYESKRQSNDYCFDNSTAPATPSPQMHHEDVTKIKVHYFGAIYVVVVPTDIEFEELQMRIESKIRTCGQEFESSILGLKYEDEDGDLITISSSEDVQMGFENKGPNNTVNLYVTS